MVTVLGGGIGGTVLGGALAHRKHPVTVYERQPAPAGGAFMVLDGPAHQALDALGVPGHALEQIGHPMPAGFRFHYLPPGRNSAPSHGHRLYQRGELMTVLTDFAHTAGADIRYDHKVTAVDPATGALHGSAGELSGPGLVLAADGIDSLARAALEPQRTAVYAGQIVLYGTTGPLELDDEPDAMHFHGTLGEGPLPLASFGHLRTADMTFWFCRLTRSPISMDDIGVHPVADWAEQVRTADTSARALIDTILDATDTVHVSNCRNVPLAEAATPAAPVILFGDADHAISPIAVRGAREAVEDALALADALTTGRDPAAAMAERRIALTVAREQQARIYTRAMPQRTAAQEQDELDATGMDWVTRMWFQ